MRVRLSGGPYDGMEIEWEGGSIIYCNEKREVLVTADPHEGPRAAVRYSLKSYQYVRLVPGVFVYSGFR